jgi:hypothetical protein
VIEEKRHREIA